MHAWKKKKNLTGGKSELLPSKGREEKCMEVDMHYGYTSKKSEKQCLTTSKELLRSAKLINKNGESSKIPADAMVSLKEMF